MNETRTETRGWSAGADIANHERGFLLTGDPGFIGEVGHRTRGARATFAGAVNAANSPAQRQAVSQARAAFEHWVQAVRGEFVTFQAGDHHGAVTASLGPDRTLRKTYECSLARAQALGANAI